MRTTTWVRFTLASAIVSVGCLGIFASGCSDDGDKDEAGTEAGTDGTTPIDGSTKPDTGTPDTGTTGAGPTIGLLHAAAGVGPVRFCIQGTGGVYAVETAQPSVQTGLAYGFGGFLPVDPALAKLIPSAEITAIAVPAEATYDAATKVDKKCVDIMKENGGAGPTGTVKLPKLSPGTFQLDKTYVVAVLGCTAAGPFTADAATAERHCGSDFDAAAGNLKQVVIPLDRSPVAATEVGAQFLHLSPQVQAELGDGGLLPAVSRYVVVDAAADADADAGDDADADAGPTLGISSEFLTTTAQKYSSSPQPTTLSKSTTIPAALAAQGTGVNAYPPGADGKQPGLIALFNPEAKTGVPATMVPVLGYPSDAGLKFLNTAAAGASYTLVAIGDPKIQYSVDGGAAAYLGFRVIALPNNPKP